MDLTKFPKKTNYTHQEFTSRIVEMAWEDRTPFEAIKVQFDMSEKEVIKLMRKKLSEKSFKNWRERVTSRNSKHGKIRSPGITRGFCPTQYKLKSKKQVPSK